MPNPFFTVNPIGEIVLCVGLNSTGQYIVASVTGGEVYTSSNYGTSFTLTGSGINSFIPQGQQIVSSSDGQYFVIISDGNGVYTSNNYGASWTYQVGSPVMNSLVSNASGNLFIGCGMDNNIYKSVNYGVTWTSTTPSEPMYLINGTSTNYLVGIKESGRTIWTSTDQGATWTLKNNTVAFKSASISEDGQTIYAQPDQTQPSPLQISLNGGATWRTISVSGYSYNVNCSSSGSTAVVSSAFPLATGIYWTNDYGATWTGEIYNTTNSDNWVYVNISGNGLIGAAGNYNESSVFTFALPASPPTPANICFPKGTPIETDQGTYAIDKLASIVGRRNTTITIGDKPVVAISQTLSINKSLVCFEQHALGPNKPDKATIVSREHKVGYKGQLFEAKHFLSSFPKDKVHTVPCSPNEILYNVLFDDYSTIKVNNLFFESLHPENPIAILLRNLNNTYVDVKKLLKNEKPKQKMRMNITKL